MGYSTPKKPFDLGEFLSQKATTRAIRKPTWQRRGAAAVKPAASADQDAPGPAPASDAE